MEQFENVKQDNASIEPQYSNFFDIEFYRADPKFLSKTEYELLPEFLSKNAINFSINNNNIIIIFNVNAENNTLENLLKDVPNISRINVNLHDKFGNSTSKLIYEVKLHNTSYDLSYEDNKILKLFCQFYVC